MVIRRRALNPAKVKADYAALEAKPPEKVFRRRFELRRMLSVVLMNLLSAVLLMVSFAPFGHWYLAYVALIPWTLGLIGGTTRRWSLIWCFVGGVSFWAAAVYWLTWITLPGYFGLIFMMAMYWLIAGAVVRSALLRNMPAWLVLPVVWVALEYLRAYVISGFPWFFLAHSQYAQTRLIQIVDTTGQYGVSFFVAMVNGALVDLLASPIFVRTRKGAKLTRQVFIGAAVAAVSLAGMLGYGYWRLSQGTTEPGPVIGIVQQDFPVALGRPLASPEKILGSHVELTLRRLKGVGCDLVVWPETVLPSGMNPQLQQQNLGSLKGDDLRSLAKTYLGINWPEAGEDDVRGALRMCLRTGGRVGGDDGLDHTIIPARTHAETLASLTRELGCPLLAGGSTIHRNPQPVGELDQWEVRNSALWMTPGEGVTAIHSKRHLVPFGEYLPFKRSLPWVYGLLRKCVPPEMPQLAPGERVVRFTLPRREGEGQNPWRLASPICFEGTFARVCREMVMKDGRKVVDILVNMSNDGWFVFQWGNASQRSTEHSQHLVQYCFRAIENRVPVIRAVNTGISASIDSNGVFRRILRAGDDPDLPVGQGQTLIPGTLLLGGDEKTQEADPSIRGPQILVDSRVSPYSRVGDVFAMVVALAAGLITVWVIFRPPGQRTKVQEK